MIISFIKENFFNILNSILLFAILGIMISVIIIFIFYFIYKYVKQIINNNNILSDNVDYEDETKKIIEKYKEHRIQNVYLVYKKVSKHTIFICNIVSYFTCDTYLSYEIKKIKRRNPNFELYHSSLLFELKTKDNEAKFILLQKKYNVELDDNVELSNDCNIIHVPLKKGKYTIKKILDKTKKTMGPLNFFNWNLTKNDCQKFTKNVLKSIKKEYYSNNVYEQQQNEYNDIKISELFYLCFNTMFYIFTHSRLIKKTNKLLNIF